VDPVSDPLLLRKSGSVGSRTRASGYVARNFDRQTTEVVGDGILKTSDEEIISTYTLVKVVHKIK
jgi:hypothetical protein